MKLEELQPEARVRGIIPDGAACVIGVQWHGSEALTLVYRRPDGQVADEILYRHDEARLEVLEQGRLEFPRKLSRMWRVRAPRMS
jgi:hypothetical protein